MNKANYEKMLEMLAFILHCPVCNNKYNAETTSIIEPKEQQNKYNNSQDSSMLVHTECEQCKSSVVFNISMEGPEIFSVGMVTDLTSADVAKFRDANCISLDEAIEFHDYLQTFDGDFERALR